MNKKFSNWREFLAAVEAAVRSGVRFSDCSSGGRWPRGKDPSALVRDVRLHARATTGESLDFEPGTDDYRPTYAEMIPAVEQWNAPGRGVYFNDTPLQPDSSAAAAAGEFFHVDRMSRGGSDE